ncbi:hypothetical protein J132_10874 [Termitomyces sp. J132]|nr:hypothetical protein H2248_011417 [Termitomyces sp. 'cryptogamus']KNZ76927.1 hypothetical protein J132_10874 [Termitomyces sp. J132]
MITIAYAVLLVSLTFGIVPEAWAAPIGTRTVHVKTMRRMPFEKEHMRRVHHSAMSMVQRDDVRVATVEAEPFLQSVSIVAREPATTTPAVIAGRETTSSVKPISVAARDTPPSAVTARHEGPHHNLPKSASSDTTTSTESKEFSRRHHAKNEARGVPATPRALPRFKRDEAGRQSVSKDKEVLQKRKTSASDANVAREPTNVQKKSLKMVKGTQERKTETEKIHKKREPAPQPTPVRPIMMFRRALAFEDLD